MLYKILKWLVVTVIAFVFGVIIVTVSLYRIPISVDPIIISGEIKYKFLNFDFSYRGTFEELALKSRSIHLVGGENLFISKEDHQRIWEVNPHEMKKLGYTLQAEFEVRKVLVGDYGLAKLVKLEKIEKTPVITK